MNLAAEKDDEGRKTVEGGCSFYEEIAPGSRRAEKIRPGGLALACESERAVASCLVIQVGVALCYLRRNHGSGPVN